MPIRTFTVYQDASPVKKPAAPRPLGRSVSAAAVVTSSSRRSENNHTTVSLPEKENLHPLTGASMNGSSSSGKKRKASQSSSVLAPKVLGVASEAPGSAKSKLKRAELKRKASSQTSSGKEKVKKETTKKGGSERKPLSDVGATPSPPGSTPKSASRAGSRSVSTPVLATIKEEDASHVEDVFKSETSTESITQALIDSRCYELTVSPLADVSVAYLQSSDVKEESKIDESVGPHKEESDTSAQLRDYVLFDGLRLDSQSSNGSLPSLPTPRFSDELNGSKLFDFTDTGFSDNVPKSAPVTPKKPRRFARSRSLPTTPTKNSKKTNEEVAAFAPILLSTPERKERYATFTFTTPKSTPAEIL